MVLSQLLPILRTDTLRQSSVTGSSTIINGLLGAFFYILVARFLGPEDFGLLMIAITTLSFLADTVDFGLNAGLTRFISKYAAHPEQSGRYMKLGLEIKLLSWVVVLVVGMIVAPLIANSLFHKPELETLLRLVMLGVGGSLLFTLITTILQSFQRYYLWGAINIFSNGLRLGLIALLISLGTITSTSTLLIFITVPFIGFIGGLFLLPVRSVLSAENEWGVAKQLYRFNIWVGLTIVLSAFSSRLDTFLNASFLTEQQVGVYAAANQLTAIMPQMIGALGVVTAPKFSSFNDHHTMLVYFKKLILLVVTLAILGVVSLPLLGHLIPLLLGDQYAASIAPFQILFVAMMLFLIAGPLHDALVFYYNRPHVYTYISLLNVFVMAIGGYYLITHFGIIGTALTVLLTMSVNLFIPLIYFLFIHRKK